ncbi:phosphohistidine phosphatase SixA [Umezakia ovalisporum]|jgi:phosphohistidine phosphatase|uniref:Phosphohistidine phosphatase SixA n=2 Tax=Umezakia ovalisporum TaxID=75695 RepID=A0AA43KG18_9CYAN|nr:phosphohistidine phosphatase SixA [Umezakia ovalisporum]MBI1240751.1 phosphohistidine phosphatase SixA [Nostoc sp. RI_552]MDH6057986.1 phosphohistidine phosphatase SixA [Umezakia ovalisporum FSS-43]MDH6065201.1 phosphohistidine phosphatase SixA [Umezakia ovalisporum FSS-62]MDH6066906.1 phosphohistidine phosphatase SixA [Umezakia ovalisporum APH033B]MDH6072009.1 phosphohistidine phosphatase SixA [Umezakia ovalisporum CobakiLakeA]
MQLYLIRHGIAEEKQPDIKDEDRRLTQKGRQKTEKVARKIKKLGLQFDVILTSPLVRARQTAEILVANKLSTDWEESFHLAPNGHIHRWLNEWLEPKNYAQKSQIALVGHEPCLSNWAEILLWGEVKNSLVLKKTGMIGIKLPEMGSPLGRSQMFWLIPPRYLL